MSGSERSALHGFMVDGHVDELLYEELDTVREHRQYAGEWVDALARYCLAREDTGPMAAWTRQAMNEAEARAEEWLTAVGVNVDALHEQANGNGADRRSRFRDLLSKKQIKTETAAQLIDAAFTLGLEAGRTRARTTGARRLVRQHAIHAAA
jgi:hypothetical protein